MRAYKIYVLSFITSLALLITSVSFPLLTYSLSLAMFGLFHVNSEMAYVQARFGDKIKRSLAMTLMLLLVAVALIRVALIMGWLSLALGHKLEITLVFLLCLSVIPLIKQNFSALFFGVIILFLLLLGLLISPVYTLMILAILHNWTPVAFIAEATLGQKRLGAMIGCVIAFFLMPLLIASGIPYAILNSFGFTSLEASVLPTGPLAAHLGVYIPAFLHSQAYAVHAFSAIVFAQCLHYVTTICVFPRLSASASIRKTRWSLANLLVCAFLFIGFVLAFKQARALYGIASAIHAWLELPILLLLLSSFYQPDKQPSTKRQSVSNKRDAQALYNA